MANANATMKRFGASEVRERPRLAVTGTFTGVGGIKTTASEEYEMLDLIFKPSRGSRKVFPKLMFRTEMFSPGFTPKIYKDYTNFPVLAEVREGKRMSVGETYAFVYANNVLGVPKVDKNGVYILDKKTGNKIVDRITSLMAFCGGTLESLEGLDEAFDSIVDISGRETGPFGVPEYTSEEIVNVLKQYHESVGEVEQLAILKQSVMNDVPQDNYEVAEWLGPLSQESHEKLVKRAQKTEAKEDITQQIKIAYTL